MNKSVKKNLEKTEYKKYLEELEDPNYQGGSWALPENPTPLEVTKYEICKLVVSHKQDKKLTTQIIAKKIQLSQAETEDILYYRINHFTLDRLMEYAGRLFNPLQVKMTLTSKKLNKSAYARTV